MRFFDFELVKAYAYDVERAFFSDEMETSTPHGRLETRKWLKEKEKVESFNSTRQIRNGRGVWGFSGSEREAQSLP